MSAMATGRSVKPEVLLAGLTFPEGPRWHDGKLWFSDFYTKRVMTLDLAGSTETIVRVPQRPSGLGWLPGGDLVVVSMLDRRVLRLEDGMLEPYADLAGLAGGPCNDMVVDAGGSAYVGNFGFDRHAGESPRTTAIARVDPAGHAAVAAGDLMFPNGMVISPDGRTFVVAETYAHRLTAFALGADGALGKRRLFAEIAGCYPDGICLDAEGAIWVADARGHQLLRVFDGGRIAERISTEPDGAYACMLGGAERRTLFICMSSGSGPAMAEKRDGKIASVEVEVPGTGLP